ncbi:hypothetical protein COMA2_50260 [Candidatus Nitrospira nitrificans]|uniref:Uncharacterized protein n=1 Tax=Candidatus Nitrospira nitrificans TaxID=1742973 RepID=A0A0S4LUT0_9BACT|nr:hypothetical protein COMA2_50260 [Candidatus Nitrospira nitrificans]
MDYDRPRLRAVSGSAVETSFQLMRRHAEELIQVHTLSPQSSRLLTADIRPRAHDCEASQRHFGN